MIDWESKESHLLTNPKGKEKISFSDLPSITGHIWIPTSGSSRLKIIALSKKAFLVSARSVNAWIGCTSTDIWINPLPKFHVGGLSIFARSYLSGAKNYPLKKWSPQDYTQLIKEKKGSLSSLVPTQIYDLVTNQVESPKSLRALFVGGGALSDELYAKAKDLGWPILLTYGMTECSSQIASSQVSSKELYILPHVEVRIDQGLVSIKSEALLTGYLDHGNFIDPKKDGWYLTEDRGEISGKKFTLFGRDQYFVKVSGENVNLQRLNLILEEINDLPIDMTLLSKAHPRLENIIVLYSESKQVDKIVTRFNQRVAPFERIQEVVKVDKIERTQLGKIRLSSIKNCCSTS